MAKDKKQKAIKTAPVVVKPVVDETKQDVLSVPPVPPAPPAQPAETVVGGEQSTSDSVKKTYYNRERAKAYRDKIHAAAVAGGHVFKEKGVGGGTTVKKTSKTGKDYYYQPWSQLTDEQKKSRLEAARKRDAANREYARQYRAEHPDEFKPQKQEGVA